MSNLLFLDRKHFRVVDGPNNNKLLGMNVLGFSMVLFYSKKCSHCHTFIPIFKQIPKTISGCKFAMINVSNNPEVAKMSESTITPITYVPYIIFYINGKPFMRYDGPRTEQAIKNFIIEVSKKLKNKQYFSKIQNFTSSHPDQEEIPPYCIATPKCDGESCYLDYDDAYS